MVVPFTDTIVTDVAVAHHWLLLDVAWTAVSVLVDGGMSEENVGLLAVEDYSI